MLKASMRQIFLALILIVTGLLVLGLLWLGMFPPHIQPQPVDHVVPLSSLAH
jgi:hypothetical protein